MMRTEKGITLIALVITIIVMLILVGVTITMAVNGGLFNYAKEAAEGTKNAINDENNIGAGIITVRKTSGTEVINEVVDIGTYLPSPNE